MTEIKPCLWTAEDTLKIAKEHAGYGDSAEDLVIFGNELLLEYKKRNTPASPDAVREAWINPHDKTQKQWLPWIKERVFVRLKSGDIHEGWHTGGSWRLYAKPCKQITNDAVSAWCYQDALKAQLGE